MQESDLRSRPIIEVKDIRKEYPIGDETVVALKRINLSVSRGEICCIFGTSGSGKSTLLNQLASFRQKHLGFVFQSYNLLPNLTATENVAMPLLFRGVPKQQREAAARKLLTRVGLAHRLDHFPRQMSGGQQQRAGIARAFIARPDVVFADEPTGNLDSKTTVEIMEMICSFARDYHQTIILVTHDPEMASYADRIVTLIDGEIVSNQLNNKEKSPS